LIPWQQIFQEKNRNSFYDATPECYLNGASANNNLVKITLYLNKCQVVRSRFNSCLYPAFQLKSRDEKNETMKAKLPASDNTVKMDMPCS
jgi:hypothetical protein